MGAGVKNKSDVNDILYNRRNSFFSKRILDCLDMTSGENVLYLGVDKSVFPGFANSLEGTDSTQRYDGIVSPLGSHQAKDLPRLLKNVYASLQSGGCFVSEWIDVKSAEIFLEENDWVKREGEPFTFYDLTDYWSFTREAGFEAVFVTQLSIQHKKEAVDHWLGNRDIQLSPLGEEPWLVNRLIAVKG
ncbi:MAG TPA: hypothetical protein VEY51_15840 [Chondromyces sp.]|nr:hypothetical protein [Chondromyces sp.]